MQPRRQPNPETFFKDWFLRLRAFMPYPWQTALFVLILAGTPPSLLYIPTGGGKTDLLTAWLLAICFQLSEFGIVTAPRRLYSAVDRRIMVDQTEKVAQALLGKLETEPQLLSLLSDATASKGMPLVVSVMRGQRVTDQEPLIADPSRFGIVLCTPDMLLSRLLFADSGALMASCHVRPDWRGMMLGWFLTKPTFPMPPAMFLSLLGNETGESSRSGTHA